MLRALLKKARDDKRKSAWGRGHIPSAHLTSGAWAGAFPSSAPGPTITTPTPTSPIILPTVPRVATPRPSPELPVTHIPPRPPSPPKYHPSNLPFGKALDPLWWDQHHRQGITFKEPEPEPEQDDPMEPDPDIPMESPALSSVSPTLSKPDVQMTSPFVPYQPNPAYTQNPSYELQAREQPSAPWQEILSQPSTPMSKRAISPTSEVSTPKHYRDSAGRSVPVTPAQSVPHSPGASVPNTNLRHTVELPFGSTPVPAIPELPET